VSGGALMNIKWVSIVSTTYVHNIFHSKRNGERDDKKLCCSSCRVPVVLVIF